MYRFHEFLGGTASGLVRRQWRLKFLIRQMTSNRDRDEALRLTERKYRFRRFTSRDGK